MCPVCLAAIGQIVAGVASTGVLATLAVKVSRKKNSVTEITTKSNESLSGVQADGLDLPALQIQKY
jgi:hypothetical protein